MDYNSIGNNIKKHRIKKKLRQDDLAEITGLSSTYIGMVERGERIPSLETLLTILDTLELSADMVLYEESSESENYSISNLVARLNLLTETDKNLVYNIVGAILKTKYGR